MMKQFFLLTALWATSLGAIAQSGFQYAYTLGTNQALTTAPVIYTLNMSGAFLAVGGMQDATTLNKSLFVGEFDGAGYPISSYQIGIDSLFMDAATPTNDGHLLVAGRVFPNGQKVQVIKISPSTGVVWNRIFSMPGEVIGGRVTGMEMTDSTYRVNMTLRNSFNSDFSRMHMAELDPLTGQTVSSSGFASSNNLRILRTHALGDGTTIYSGSADRFGRQPMIFRMDAQQNILWSFRINTSDVFELNIRDAVIADSSMVYMVGDIASSSSALDKMAFVMKLSPTGEVKFSKAYQVIGDMAATEFVSALPSSSGITAVGGYNNTSIGRKILATEISATGLATGAGVVAVPGNSLIFSNDLNQQSANRHFNSLRYAVRMYDQTQFKEVLGIVQVDGLTDAACDSLGESITMADSSINFSAGTVSVFSQSTALTNDPYPTNILPALLSGRDICSGDLVSNEPWLELDTWEVYPNPTTGIIHLDVPAEWGSMEWEVLDLTGKRILEGSALGHEEISMTGLAKGMYIIRLHTPGGIASRKIQMN
ncbi:T9SS type A sorting domain-containing protein [Pontibacter sp. G13]|uniref:T9SS type A sorting domain-containing protein n=1 Tax=Pontibacter sp. G13 TaxID=3074898 RepID=UPI00288B805E|nr:T9SS type A sorting domain-containing protein [Pontibacter sp. G13]WNJ18718.1 T9SS type A sorting domain-containing protein [Pontibacter sp. G13]